MRGSRLWTVLVLAALGLMVGGQLPSMAATPGRAVPINFAVTVGVNTAVAQRVVPICQTQLPDVKINLISIPWTSIFEKQLLDFVSRQASYDVVMHSLSMFPVYVTSGALEPLDGYFSDPRLIDRQKFELADFPQSLLPRYNGKLYALPYAVFPQILYYRTDLLKREEVPKTLDEFLEAAKRLQNPPSVYGTVIQGLKGGAGGNTYMWYALLYSFGGDLMKSGKIVVNSPEAVRSLEYFKELYKYSPPDSITWGAGQVSEFMMGGNTAMTLQNSDHLGRMLDPTRSKIAKKIAVAPYPAGSGGSRVLAGSWYLSINKDAPTERKRAAFRAITCVLGKDVMPEHAKAGGVPARISTLTGPLARQHPELELTARALRTAKGLPFVRQYMKIEDFVGIAINEVLLGQKAAQEALDAAQAKIETEMKTP